MKRPIKKMISVFLAVLMLLPVLPVLSALADETQSVGYGNTLCEDAQTHPDKNNDDFCDRCGVRLVSYEVIADIIYPEYAYFEYAYFCPIPVTISLIGRDKDGNETVLNESDGVYMMKDYPMTGMVPETTTIEKIIVSYHDRSMATSALEFDLCILIDSHSYRLNAVADQSDGSVIESEYSVVTMTSGDPAGFRWELLSSDYTGFPVSFINTVCDVEYMIDHESNGHTVTVTEGYAPTCTQIGYTDEKTCAICGCMQEMKPVNPLGHIDEDGDGICDRCMEAYAGFAYTSVLTVGDYIVDLDPVEYAAEIAFLSIGQPGWLGYYVKLDFDCYNGAELIYTGAKVKESFCTTLPVTSVVAHFGQYGHEPWGLGLVFKKGMDLSWESMEFINTVQTADGITYSVRSDNKPCETESDETYRFCDDYILDGEPHTDDHAPVYGELIECIPHTCTEDGLAYRECSVCAYKAYEIVEKAHAPEVIPGTAATCTETGLTDGVVCSVCGEILTEQEVIPAAGHVDADDDAYCDVCGEKVRDKTIIEIILDFFRRIIDFFGNLFG